MSDPILIARDLTKIYRLYDSPWHRIYEALTRRPRHTPQVALQGISFALERGDAFGIVGQNGAGKSTLLKILAGVAKPTSGSAETHGRVSSILELGSGFHPEFTGRENIRINAAMLGLREDEVAERTPSILEFSELGHFIDQPIKVYSTGMAMRLAFSIAAQVEPDILIVDEALSVGDGYFQKKCMDRIQKLVGAGTSLLFCSHAMYYLSSFCSRTLWLRHGKAEALGETREVIQAYETFLLNKGQDADGEPRDRGPLPEELEEPDERGGPARFVDVSLVGSGERSPDEPLRLQLAWTSEEPERAFHLAVGIDRVDGVQLCSFATHRDGLRPFSGRTDYRAALEVPALPLQQGELSVYAYLLDEDGLHVYDRHVLKQALRIRNDDYYVGVVEVDHDWSDDSGRSPQLSERGSSRGSRSRSPAP